MPQAPASTRNQALTRVGFPASDQPINMSLVGTKRQFARCTAMSGVGGKADLPVARSDFSV